MTEWSHRLCPCVPKFLQPLRYANVTDKGQTLKASAMRQRVVRKATLQRSDLATVTHQNGFTSGIMFGPPTLCCMFCHNGVHNDVSSLAAKMSGIVG